MCTRILWNSSKVAVMAGRTMDWPESTQPVLTMFPRGQHRHGGLAGDQVVVADNPLDWTSRFASLVTTIYGVGSADGMNERGFAAHMLYLQSTDLGQRDPARPGLQVGLWVQYLLDRAETVAEALDLLDTFQPVMFSAHGHAATVHLAMEDATGDSAIVEFLGGERVVHHGPQFTVLTNEPPYDEQLRLLAEQDYATPGMDTPVPGNVNAVDRFQRATYFSSLLPQPSDEREAAAGMLAVTRNASVPFGAPYGDFGVYNTEYRTVSDLTHRRYFFELTTSPNVIWTELGQFDLAPEAAVMTLNPHDIALSGDVSTWYTPASVGF